MSLILRRTEETFSLFSYSFSLENGSSPFYPGRHQSQFCIDIYYISILSYTILYMGLRTGTSRGLVLQGATPCYGIALSPLIKIEVSTMIYSLLSTVAILAQVIVAQGAS